MSLNPDTSKCRHCGGQMKRNATEAKNHRTGLCSLCITRSLENRIRPSNPVTSRRVVSDDEAAVVRRLAAQWKSQQEIHTITGLARTTIRRILKAAP